jgi:superfamily I DNA/RNA helicase
MPKDNSSKIISAIPKLLEEGKKRTGTITFSDQLWLPVVLDLPTPQFDLITIDEAQDLNKVQHLLVVRSMHKNSRVIVVGDENQAIYAFRGADTDSMASMAFMLEVTGKDVEHFPLTKTWRCGKKIVELAKEYVPEIEAHENNPEGDVLSGMLSDVEDQFLPGDMVLCRMNGPLVTLGYRLMKQGKKVHFQGKKFGEELLGIAQGLDADSINDLLIKLSSYEDGRLDKLAEKEKIGGNVKMQKIDLQDRMDCLRAFLIGLPEDMPINEVLSKMEKFFCDSQDEKDSITLTSIHRAKGRERDRVFYFKPEISFDGLSEEDERQERNLKFVAITRAKKFLCMVTANDE